MSKNLIAVRKGSIPMVLIIVVCLGIFAASSIFMTSNQAAMDKKSELNQAAWIIAQSAVEETLLKIANNKVTIVDDKRMTYPATVTRASVPLEGLTIEPVQVLKRSLTNAAEEANKAEFNELMSYLPGFLRQAAVDKAPAGAVNWLAKNPTRRIAGNTKMVYDPVWRQNMATDAAAGQYDPRFVPLVAEHAAFDGNPTGTHAKEYYDTFIAKDGAESNTATGTAVRTAFENLTPLRYLAGANEMVTGQHDPAELQSFKVQLDAANEAIANHMQNRIDGCNGDFDYAIGAMMTSFARGVPNANDSDAGEETYREGARDSGQTKYNEALVTVATKVTLRRGTQQAQQPYSAQRLVRSMNLQDVMMGLRKDVLAYLHYNYNLTAKDLSALQHPGMGSFIKPITSDTQPIEIISTALTSTLSDRFSDSPGTQIRNVQLATCMGEVTK